jgi:predicted RecB family nuclease
MKGRGMASIDTIEGIGHRQATKLRKARIRTTEALLKNGGTRKGRKVIADTTDISEKLILEWVNRADLMRVKGVGEEYSDLLEAAGVDTVKELAQRRADNLAAKMAEVNEAKNLANATPAESIVAGWITAAKETEPKISH